MVVLYITFSKIADGGDLELKMFGLTTKNYKMQKFEFKHPDPTIGNVLLSAGDFIKTKWDWWGEIKEINEIKHGQGLLVRRLNDNTIHSISDEDVIEFNHACQ